MSTTLHTREQHAAALATWTMPFSRGQLQLGANWCWAAITTSLLDQFMSGTPHRQCDVVQPRLAPGQTACSQMDKRRVCDPKRCKIARAVDMPNYLDREFTSRGLMVGVVLDTDGLMRHIDGAPAKLADCRAPPVQVEIDDVKRCIHLGHYLVLRFRQGRMAHFVIVYGYAISPSIKAVRFFDPANGAPAGLRLRRGHGILPLRELKARYGILTNLLLVVNSLPEL